MILKAKTKNGRRRRGRVISMWNLLTGKWGRRHRLSASVTGESDWEVEVPQIRMSRAFVVMLLLHVVAVGGLFAFRIWGRDEAERPAPASHTAVPPVENEVAAPEPLAPPVEAVTGTPAESARTYSWHAGDSIELVAARFGVSVSAVREANPDRDFLPGTDIIIPRAGRVIGGARGESQGSQPAELFNPQAGAAAVADARPPKAVVVPELAVDSGIPDVLPAPEHENPGVLAQPVTAAAPAKPAAVKPAASTPAIASRPAAPAAPPARSGGQRVHVVARGDTVYNLARKYGFTAEEIAKANSLDGNFSIRLGQQLRIPVKR
jgi:LysM repeat protein